VGLGLEQQLRSVEWPLSYGRILRFSSGADQWKWASSRHRPALIFFLLGIVSV